VNNTILWNQSQYECAGIYCVTGAVLIANNIVAFNAGGIRGVPEAVLRNNCVFDNYLSGISPSNYLNIADPTGIDGNISVDPQFVVDPLYLDAHLSAGSPCRDAGDNTVVQPDWVDIYGGPRVAGTAVDIGADEFDGAPPPFVPAIGHVSPTGDDANDGSTWANAQRTVQSGIDRAMLAGGGEVWVQSGTYVENLRLAHSVHLYGGFQGGETNRAQRNWTANATALDGNQNGSVIGATNLVTWNSIDGFIVRNGRNFHGGGINCLLSAPRIANNLITGNMATNYGGGIYFSFRHFPSNRVFTLVTNNVINSNQAIYGGGIYAEEWVAPVSLVLANNRLEQNTCSNSSARAAGIYLLGENYAQVAILNNFFLRNVVSNSFPSAPYGGALYNGGFKAQIINNTFLENRTTGKGGAIVNNSAASTVANNLMAFGSSGYLGVSAAIFWNNCVYGNVINYDVTDLTGTNGNISVDPLLVAADDFHLLSGSPCINAGTNSVISPGQLDLDGQVRIAGGTVDIGADEFGSALPFWLSLRLDAGQPYVGLSGETNRVYVFVASPNLVDWTAISTNLTTTPFLEIADPDPAPGHRFYRAWVEP
jgi:hypothetical protein